MAAMRKSLVYLALTLMAATGCAHSKAAGGAAAAAVAAAPASLALIPADTPYVFAMLEPVDPAIMDKFLAHSAENISPAIDGLLTGAGVDSVDQLPAGQRLLAAWLEELRVVKSAADMEKLGLSARSRFVVYGLSIFPVARLEIRDPALARTVIERVLARAKVTMPEQQLGGQAYWRVDADGHALLAAVLPTEIVVAYMPESAVVEALPLVLGQKRPDRSLAQDDTLAQIVRTHGFKSGLGYIDLRRVTALLLGKEIGPSAALAQTIANSVGRELPPSCATDAARLTALLPRVVVGYERLDTSGMAMAVTFETARDVSEAFVAIGRPVPGLQLPPAGQPLMVVGVGVDANAAIALLRRASVAVIREPFECPLLVGLNDAARELEGTLAQPLPPFVTGLAGAVGILDELVIGDGPMRVRAGGLLLGTGAAQVARSGVSALFGGQIGPLGDDGKPVALPLASFGIPGLEQAHLAIQGDRVAVAVGEGSAARARALLAAPAAASSPLVMFGFHIERFMATLGKVLGDGPATQAMGAFGEYGFTAYAIEVSADKGLSLRLVSQFK